MVAVVAALVAAPVALAQQGGASWSQFQADAAHSGTLGDGPAPPYRIRWELPAPAGPALSGAVIDGDLAYTIGRDDVYAVELATGEIVWQIPRAGGPLSVPAIAVDATGAPLLLYLEGPADEVGDGSAGSPTPSPSPTPTPSPDAAEETAPSSELVAVGTEDRQERWRVPLDDVSRAGVTVEGDAAFVADESGSVFAVGLADGDVRWTADAGAKVEVAVAVADGLVVVVARDTGDRGVIVNAFDRESGERRWRVSPQVGSSAVSGAAVADGRVVVGFADRFARALSAEDGEQLWASLVITAFSPVTSPALQPGTVFMADVNGGVYRIDAADGGRDWSYQLNDIVLRSSPVLSGRIVLLGLNDGRLVAIDAGSGRLVWQSEATQGLVGAIAVSSETIVAVKGGRDAGLVAYEHDPDAALVDVPSPTRLAAGTTVVRFGIAALIVLVVVLGPGLLARRRFGDAFPAGDDAGDADEPEEVEA